MSTEAILVCRLGAPLRIAIGRTQVRDHHRDGLPRTSTVTLTFGGNVAGIGELVALAASTPTPAA